MRECPQCGGPVWDNRQKKADGDMSPKAPDFKCRDQDDCGWVKWPSKKGGKKQKAVQRSGPKWTWPSLSKTYRDCLILAKKHIGDHVEDATSADVVAAAATLFICASRDGVQPLKREPEPEPEPDYEDAEGEDLPF